MEGVHTVAPNVARKEVLVAFEPATVTEERLREALETLGYR